MNYEGRFLKIRKAIHSAGFDEFYQAGTPSRFHKMTVVAESAALNARFWINVDGGYGVADYYSIHTRPLDNPKAADTVTPYHNQDEMVEAIEAIGRRIAAAKIEGGRHGQVHTA